VGTVVVGQGLMVHKRDCQSLSGSNIPTEQVMDLSWRTGEGKGKYLTRLRVVLVNQPGSLATLTSLLAKADGNILELKACGRGEDFVEFLVDVEVKNVHKINEMIASLRMSSWVFSAER